MTTNRPLRVFLCHSSPAMTNPLREVDKLYQKQFCHLIHLQLPITNHFPTGALHEITRYLRPHRHPLQRGRIH